MRAVAVLCALAVASCGSDDVPSACDEAAARAGRRVCVHRVASDGEWAGVTVLASPVDQVRTTKYVVPARADARLPALVMDVNAYATHFQMFVDAFGDRFPGLTLAEYVQLITDPVVRELYAGTLTEYIAGGERVYGFVVWDDQQGADSTVTCAEMVAVRDALAGAFELTPLVAIPSSGFQRDVLAACDAVPSYDPSRAVPYEAYTRAVGYGTLRRYRVADIAGAVERAEIGFQDVVVIDEAPLDIETVISGSVTGTRQGELSHLNVRAAGRGTPNCYVADAFELTADWEGQLVRLECGVAGLTINPPTRAEAEAWWEQLRPEPVDIPAADVTWTELEGLLDVDTSTVESRRGALARYGAKAANLAVLYQRIDPALQLEGFGIPFAYYDAFARTTTWTVDLGNGPETLSFADTVARLLADDAFGTDAALRRSRLDALRNGMRAAACDPAVVDAVSARIRAVFGGDDVMVRFRSSSNAEDALAFTGAGLYDSTSVCLADDLDGDDVGPSRCDPDQPAERTVCRGLTRVWASLWEPAAFEERAWFGIDHAAAAMGILVNTRTADERANIVAFTADPNRPTDPRYLINAQIGELDVVSAEPGVAPEKDLVTVDDGEVTAIERVRPSTEVPPGGQVLSDAQLTALGEALWTVAESYVVDAQPPPGARILLDTEWKIRSDGSLIVKQVRPFVR